MTLTSVPSTPVPPVQAAESLMQDLNAALAQIATTTQVTKKRYTRTRHQFRHATPAASAHAGAGVFDAMFTHLFLEALFGLPLFSAMGGVGGAAHSLAEVGLLMNQSDDAGNQRTAYGKSGLNRAIEAANKHLYETALNSQRSEARQLHQMKIMVMMMLIQMLEQEESGQAGGGDDMLVPDVLRHPKLARFKQNRHSMSCIRTMFSNQAESFAPTFKAPRYNFG